MIFKKKCLTKPNALESLLNDSPIIISIPHSGRNYEKKFLNQTNLNINDLRRSEDAYVDEILFLNLNNVSFLKANFPRIFVDVNRTPLEIDPFMWEQNALKKLYNQKTQKVLSGIGVFPKVTLNGDFIYRHKLPYSEAQRRFFNYYFPYHKKIREIIKFTKKKFKKAIVLDCHSMSSEIIDNNVDFVLSNGDGKTASKEIIMSIKKKLNKYGYEVNINDPFKGGFISMYHSNVKKNIHFVQVEINKKLYMFEKNLIINKKKIADLQLLFEEVIRQMHTKFI